MSAKNPKKNISEQEIRNALQKFQEQGGLIKKLPEQVVLPSTLVGTRWAMYEGVGEPGDAG